LVFYKEAFDLSPSFVHKSGHFAELFSGVVTLAFRSEEMATNSLPQKFQSNHPNSTLQAFEISFHTKDVDTVYQKAIGAGATDTASPHLTPWGQTAANVRDPSGILIEITEYPK
jgi:lactoylglutathione lyase